MGTTSSDVRRMWVATEHVHLVTYFAPEAMAAYAAEGITGFWRGYFGGRSAPMGAVGPGTVVATFFGFHPGFVARAVPDVWERAAPGRWLAARSAGSADALRSVVDLDDTELAPVTEALLDAARGASASGRPLFGANLDVEIPEDPVAALWQACTLWREHRGDGHVAALTAAGLDGCESHVLRLAVAGGDGALMRAARGWSDDDWSDATDRLASRGLLAADGSATDAGRSEVADIESVTDRLATPPVDDLGPSGVEEVLAVLEPIARRIRAAMTMPDPNPIGVPAP